MLLYSSLDNVTKYVKTTSGLSTLIHRIISFSDAMSCENRVYRKLTFLVAQINVTMSAATKIKSPKPSNQMGLVMRKPVFGGLRTTKAQTSLHIRAV